jgi:transcriptional pleiotropic regulator of transition state genes
MTVKGIIRRVDPVGRVVIPMEIRRCLNIHYGDSIEILVQNDQILLRKPAQACTFCGSEKKLVDFKSQKVCQNCLKKIKSM